MMRRTSFIAFSTLLLVSACTRKGISVYDAPKEAPAPAQAAEMMSAQGPAESQVESAPPSGAPFQWTVPKGWTSGAASNMRIASFRTPQGGDVSIVVLGGEAGGRDANVNRWRGQIGLSNLSPAQINGAIKTVQSKVGAIQWIRLENPQQPEKAFLAAILSFHGSTVFIKNVASIQSLPAQVGPFLSFLKSFQENSGSSNGDGSQ